MNANKPKPEIPNAQHNRASPLKSGIGYGDYLRLCDLVLKRSGLYFPEKKRSDPENGLLKALAESSLAPANGSHNLDHYYNALRNKSNRTGRAEMARLINGLISGNRCPFS